MSFTGLSQNKEILEIEIPSKTENETDSLAKQKQFSDILFKIIKLKKLPKNHNDSINVGKIMYVILPGIGYSLQSNFTGILTTNLSVYCGEKKTTNISVLNSDIQYSPLYKQTMIMSIFNIWPKENKFNVVGDLRFLIFPSPTYGLGAYTYQNKFDQINYTYLKQYIDFFIPIKKDYYFGLGYKLDYHYNITSSSFNTDFQAYNNFAKQTISSGVYISLKYDGRRNINNPPDGMYFDIGYRANSTYLGSNNNWQSLLIDSRLYIKIKKTKTNILSFWSYDWLTFGHVPYLDLPSTGWDTYANLARGYIQGRFRGPNLIYLESEYRMGLTKNGLLGMVVFANAQSYSEWKTNRFEKIIPAGGTGLRLKLNKKSNVNMAIDYAIGIDGARGFFFNIGEVF